MKRLFHTIYLALALVALTGCTHNDGDIGDLFGTWRLDVIRTSTYSSEELGEMYSSEEVTDVFWCFQSNIIMMERVKEHHEVTKRFGTWTRGNSGIAEWPEAITLNFNHSDNDFNPGTGRYEVIQGIYLPGGEMKLFVRTLNKDIMVLSYVDDQKHLVHTYYFTKW